jgi:hypothetical protein
VIENFSNQTSKERRIKIKILPIERGKLIIYGILIEIDFWVAGFKIRDCKIRWLSLRLIEFSLLGGKSE